MPSSSALERYINAVDGRLAAFQLQTNETLRHHNASFENLINTCRDLMADVERLEKAVTNLGHQVVELHRRADAAAKPPGHDIDPGYWQGSSGVDQRQ